jgi:hypothetical protein
MFVINCWYKANHRTLKSGNHWIHPLCQSLYRCFFQYFSHQHRPFHRLTQDPQKGLRLTLSEKHNPSCRHHRYHLHHCCYYHCYHYYLSIDPIVVIVDVPPHAIAGNEGNHGDICAVDGLVSVGETNDAADVDEGWVNVVWGWESAVWGP